MKVQVSEVFKHDFIELKGPYSKQPEISEHINVLPVLSMHLSLCCRRGKVIQQKEKVQPMAEGILENLILFVSLQSSCDVLSYLTKQSWSITVFPTFPGYDHSKCSILYTLKLWKTSPILVYKILYCNSLRDRRGQNRFLSNWIPKIKINIKNTQCTAPLHPKQALKNPVSTIFILV